MLKYTHMPKMSNEEYISYKDFEELFCKKNPYTPLNNPFCLCTIHETYVSVTRNYIGPSFLQSYRTKKPTRGDAKKKMDYHVRNKRILQLGMAVQWETFITITFSPENYPDDLMENDWDNYQEFQRKFRKFIRRLNYHFVNLKYLAVLEHGKKRSRVHYHILTNIPYNNPLFRHEHTEKRQVCDLWEFGYSDVQKVQNDNCNAVFYLLKYIEKGDANRTPIGKREVFASKGLAQEIRLICKEEDLGEILEGYQYYDTTYNSQIFIKNKDFVNKIPKKYLNQNKKEIEQDYQPKLFDII